MGGPEVSVTIVGNVVKVSKLATLVVRLEKKRLNTQKFVDPLVEALHANIDGLI